MLAAKQSARMTAMLRMAVARFLIWFGRLRFMLMPAAKGMETA